MRVLHAELNEVQSLQFCVPRQSHTKQRQREQQAEDRDGLIEKVAWAAVAQKRTLPAGWAAGAQRARPVPGCAPAAAHLPLTAARPAAQLPAAAPPPAHRVPHL